jgi:citrate synthase
MTDYSPGLAGVPAARSKISYLDGIKGILEYRGIPIQVLAEKSNYLETTWLLLFGRLPNREEFQKFSADVTDHRRIKFRIRDLMKCLPEGGHPMDALQAAVAALGMFYPAKNVQEPGIQYISSVRLIAKLPTIVAAHARMRHGDDPILPRADLDHAANFLYMLSGREPDPMMAKILDVCLVLHAEHTMNASTFSGMVTASTLADAYSVVSSAIGTLLGPLHGGANQQVLEMLSEIGSKDRVAEYADRKLSAGQKIPGFGHREYKVKDVRAVILEKLAGRLFQKFGGTAYFEVARELERVMSTKTAHKGVYPNVDFYSGIVYEKLGIDTDLFTPVFAIARVAGWLAHWIEQLKDNHIFRPTEIYEGQRDVAYAPIEKRS